MLKHPDIRAHNLPLVGALTKLSWANTEAAAQAEPRLVPYLEATARTADEAARAVQFNRELTAGQAVLVAQCQETLTP